MRKIPTWMWLGVVLFCCLEWTVQFWGVAITHDVDELKGIVLFLGLILYPLFAIPCVVHLLRSMNDGVAIGILLLLVPIVTNIFLYQVLFLL